MIRLVKVMILLLVLGGLAVLVGRPALAQYGVGTVEIGKTTGVLGIKILPPRVYVRQTGRQVQWHLILAIEDLLDSASDVNGANASIYNGQAVLEQTFYTRPALESHFDQRTTHLEPKTRITWDVTGRLQSAAAQGLKLVYSFGCKDQGGESYAREISIPLQVFTQKTAVRLPFDGAWLVRNGHGSDGHGHYGLLNVPSEDFAWDFVILGEGGLDHQGDPADNTRYFAYAKPILAVAAGKVAALRDTVADHAPGSIPPALGPADQPGNYLVIDHGGGLFSLSAGLKQGSIQVKVGDPVTAGQAIAQVGNSGNTPYPQLHFQFMDGADFLTASGLPARFARLTRQAGGGTGLEDSDPLTGWVVSP